MAAAVASGIGGDDLEGIGGFGIEVGGGVDGDLTGGAVDAEAACIGAAQREAEWGSIGGIGVIDDGAWCGAFADGAGIR